MGAKATQCRFLRFCKQLVDLKAELQRRKSLDSYSFKGTHVVSKNDFIPVGINKV